MSTIAAFYVPVEILKAVSLFSAKQDARGPLNGVAFYKVGTVLTLTASNGHVLGIFQNMNCTNTSEDFCFLLSLDSIKALSGNAKKGTSIFLYVIKGTDGKILIESGVTGLTVKVQEDAPLKLDSLRRVNATHKAGEGVNTVSIDGDYLVLLGKVAALFGAKYNTTHLVLGYKDSAVRASFGGLLEGWQFNGTVMPLRACTADLYSPVF